MSPLETRFSSQRRDKIRAGHTDDVRAEETVGAHEVGEQVRIELWSPR